MMTVDGIDSNLCNNTCTNSSSGKSPAQAKQLFSMGPTPGPHARQQHGAQSYAGLEREREDARRKTGLTTKEHVGQHPTVVDLAHDTFGRILWGSKIYSTHHNTTQLQHNALPPPHQHQLQMAISQEMSVRSSPDFYQLPLAQC